MAKISETPPIIYSSKLGGRSLVLGCEQHCICLVQLVLHLHFEPALELALLQLVKPPDYNGHPDDYVEQDKDEGRVVEVAFAGLVLHLFFAARAGDELSLVEARAELLLVLVVLADELIAAVGLAHDASVALEGGLLFAILHAAKFFLAQGAAPLEFAAMRTHLDLDGARIIPKVVSLGGLRRGLGLKV